MIYLRIGNFKVSADGRGRFFYKKPKLNWEIPAWFAFRLFW